MINKRKIVGTVMSSALVASLCVAPAHAIVGGENVTYRDRWLPNVVQVDNLEPVNGDASKKTFCTGTLINPPENSNKDAQWVITAKHCLIRNGKKRVPPHGNDATSTSGSVGGNDVFGRRVWMADPNDPLAKQESERRTAQQGFNFSQLGPIVALVAAAAAGIPLIVWLVKEGKAGNLSSGSSNSDTIFTTVKHNPVTSHVTQPPAPTTTKKVVPEQPASPAHPPSTTPKSHQPVPSTTPKDDLGAPHHIASTTPVKDLAVYDYLGNRHQVVDFFYPDTTSDFVMLKLRHPVANVQGAVVDPAVPLISQHFTQYGKGPDQKYRKSTGQYLIREQHFTELETQPMVRDNIGYPVMISSLDNNRYTIGGDSGGPVFNDQGQLIAVHSFIYSGTNYFDNDVVLNNASGAMIIAGFSSWINNIMRYN